MRFWGKWQDLCVPDIAERTLVPEFPLCPSCSSIPWVPGNQPALCGVSGSWFLWKYCPNKDAGRCFFSLFQIPQTEAANASVKDQFVEYFRLCQSYGRPFVTTTQLLPRGTEMARQLAEQWRGLGFHKMRLMNTEIGILHNFHTSRIVPVLFPPTHFKM